MDSFRLSFSDAQPILQRAWQTLAATICFLPWVEWVLHVQFARNFMGRGDCNMKFYHTFSHFSHCILHHILQLAWLAAFLLLFQFRIFWLIWPLCCLLVPFKLIYHQNMNPFALGHHIYLDPPCDHFALPLPTCRYLKKLADPMQTLVDPMQPPPPPPPPPPPKKKKNASTDASC